MELIKPVPAYSWLFIIFANTEIYVKLYKTYWKNVKTTFDKFFQCIAHLGFNCSILLYFSGLFSRGESPVFLEVRVY